MGVAIRRQTEVDKWAQSTYAGHVVCNNYTIAIDIRISRHNIVRRGISPPAVETGVPYIRQCAI